MKYKLTSIIVSGFMALSTLFGNIVSAQNTMTDSPAKSASVTLTSASTQDEWNAARLQGEEPAGFSNQKTSKPYVWDAQWLTSYARDENGRYKTQELELGKTSIIMVGWRHVKKPHGVYRYVHTPFPMVSEQDADIKAYTYTNGDKSLYPESLPEGLVDNIDGREQGRTRKAEYRFPRLVGKVYAWSAEGKLLGVTVLNHDLISPQIWAEVIHYKPEGGPFHPLYSNKGLYENIEQPLLKAFSAYKKDASVYFGYDELKRKEHTKPPDVDLSSVAFFTNTDKAPEMVIFKPVPKEVSAKLNAIALSEVETRFAEENRAFKDRPGFEIRTLASLFKPCEAKFFDLGKDQESRQIYVYSCVAKGDLQGRAGLSQFHKMYELNAKGDLVPIRIRYQLIPFLGNEGLKPQFVELTVSSLPAQARSNNRNPEVTLLQPKYYSQNQASLIANASFEREYPAVRWSLKAGAKAGDVYTITKETWPEPYLE